jgi:hypothetical protein
MTIGVKRDIIVMLNNRVGLFTRLFPSPLSVRIDQGLYRAKNSIPDLRAALRKFKNRALGL